MSEDAFLQALLADAGADDRRLVYADWLEEQGDAVSVTKAEFLRVTAQLAAEIGPKGQRQEQRERLQQLAAGLDTDWLALVSRLDIENCHQPRKAGGGRRPRAFPIGFSVLCERHWEDLHSTDDPSVRFCDSCQQRVFYCDTITEARRHANNARCIAVDLGVIRREGDLEAPGMYLGRPSAETLRREQELAQPDPVSAERERRKRQKRQEEARR
jgi:uncharacterized protein (TIGR02996 family)